MTLVCERMTEKLVIKTEQETDNEQGRERSEGQTGGMGEQKSKTKRA